MGVPGFYSWLIKRYPLVKHLIEKEQVPSIDYLYLDMNGIIYKCVKDDSIIFKSQIVPKEMEQIWLDVFNYINMLVNILKPNKMVVMGLDGVAPRAKMNNQRSRRFKSSRDHKKFMQKLEGFAGETQSAQNFKNNSISPGTAFMEELGNNLEFFIKKKIQEDDYWKSLSVIFTSSSSPGEGQHKIMQFIRSNQTNFDPQDTHCLYGADADLIMLSMTLPLKNLCIIREQFVPGDQKVKIAQSKKEKVVRFQMIFVTILRQYFQIQYGELRDKMKIPFQLDRVIKDFVFLFFFIGNDFLPRCYAYNIRTSQIEDLILAFKLFLTETDDYVVGAQKLNIKSLTKLANAVATREGRFLVQKQEDFARNNKQEQSFDQQFKQLVKTKAVKQQEFINQLKTYYLNDQTSARSLYYGQYFGINPAEKSTQFYQILNYYLSGLQFVFEYYFINLPSWDWYYPYYCAPLVSDLFFYLNYLSQNNFELPKIEPGHPFPPFKQLLCILPKESCQLVPLAFRKYFNSPQSILRTPVDYYPDKFEQQPYGSLKEHEYIALIPYLDIALINKAYDEAIVNVEPEDLKRNQLLPSKLFEFDKLAQQMIIESKFKAIPTTSCTIAETKINLRQKIKWGKNNPIIKPLQKNLFKMPSLKVKSFFSSEEKDKRGKKYYVLELKADKEAKFKVGEEVFYGYPLEKSGKVEAVLSKEEFNYSNNEFDSYNYDIDRLADFRDNKLLRQNPKFSFEKIKDYLIRQFRLQFNWDEVDRLLFIKDTQQFVRCLDGNFKRVYTGAEKTQYEIIPTVIVTKTKTYQNTMDKIQFNSLQEEFGLGENVLVFPRDVNKQTDRYKLDVHKGKVVGYTDSKVKVQLGQKIRQVDNKKLENIVHTRQIYFTLKFCAFVLQMKVDVLLTLLQTINIEINHPELPSSIDIGLNFINRHEAKLVPNLVRIAFESCEDSSNVQKMFRNLDVSLKGFQLIIEYKKNFPKIIEFIEKRYEKLIENRDEKGKINWRQKISLDQIYGQQQNKEKAVKSLMNVYLWLIKQEETHLPLSSIYSKQISVKNIKRLQQEFVYMNNKEKEKKHKYGDPQIVQVDPNFLFSRRLANYGKMHLSRPPCSSTIRDQVVCLHPEFFGQSGVIIGFDYNKFQVMFNKPSFGKSDLNGICDDLWAGKFYERDLYNFQTWPDVMKSRKSTKNSAENLGWDGGITQVHLPKFKEKALREFADIEALNQKKNIFSEQFLQYIKKMKQKRKVQRIDEDYQVIDNRKGEYTYKYDKGKASITNQFVKQVAKDKKYMQKPIETSLKSEEVQKQIIENKVEKKEEVGETKLPENEEEDDVDDMLK